MARMKIENVWSAPLLIQYMMQAISHILTKTPTIQHMNSWMTQTAQSIPSLIHYIIVAWNSTTPRTHLLYPLDHLTPL